MSRLLIRFGLFFALANGLAGILIGQTQPSRDPDGLPVQRGAVQKRSNRFALKIDPIASRIYAKVAAEGLGHVHGIQGRLASGTIEFGGGGELVFDMRSFVADLPEVRESLGLTKVVTRSDQQKVTATMRGADVLDVGHYPKASLVMSAVTPLDGQTPGNLGRYELQGEFTLHGVKHSLQLLANVEPTEQPNVFRMRSTFSILQSQYGIMPYSALGGMVRVSDRLEIWGDLVIGDFSR